MHRKVCWERVKLKVDTGSVQLRWAQVQAGWDLRTYSPWDLSMVLFNSKTSGPMKMGRELGPRKTGA